jgi:hypothetical protein
VLDIRSVTISTVSIPRCRTSHRREPDAAHAAQRNARRADRPASRPIRSTWTGRPSATPYARHLGYSMVVDGSVRMKVPANVAFQISILDGEGKRISPVHRNWLQLRPGEVLTCNGCHTRTAQNAKSHGRAGSFAAAYTGATGGAYAGADPTIAPQSGETIPGRA